MKKAIIIGFCLATMVLMSCSKDDDFTDPDNLFGTEWKSMDSDEGQYDLQKLM